MYSGSAGHVAVSALISGMPGWREQPPRGPPWVSGLVAHFVQTWPDSELLSRSAVLRL